MKYFSKLWDNKAVKVTGAIGAGLCGFLGSTCNGPAKATPQDIAKIFVNNKMDYQNELVMDSDVIGRTDVHVNAPYLVKFNQEPPDLNYFFHHIGYDLGDDGSKGRPVYRVKMRAEKRKDAKQGWVVQDIENTSFSNPFLGNNWTDHTLTAKLDSGKYAPIYSVDSSALAQINDVGDDVDKILRCCYPYESSTDLRINDRWVPISTYRNLIKQKSSDNDPLSISKLEGLLNANKK
jgi:hypothetical protein